MSLNPVPTSPVMMATFSSTRPPTLPFGARFRGRYHARRRRSKAVLARRREFVKQIGHDAGRENW
jgi:hypothetical protein